MYKLYILHSKSLNRYYIGSTSNIEERLKRHLSNHNGFTRKAKDWEVVYIEEYSSKQEALIREKQLKGWKSAIRITELIARSRDALSSVGSEHPDL